LNDNPERRGRFDIVPAQDDDPVVWDTKARQFVRRDEGSAGEPASGNAPSRPAEPSGNGDRAGHDERRYYVGPDAVGKAPPPRRPASSAPAPPATGIVDRTDRRGGVPAGAVAALNAPAARPVDAPAALEARTAPPPPPRPRAPAPATAGRPPGGRRRFRIRPRVVVALLLLLPIVVVLLGLLWANWKFSQIERVDVSQVLDAEGGGGTNYLIVGSDSREGIASDDPDAGAFLGGDAGGQRSDTIMVLRTAGDDSTLMSIPRDLFVTISGTGEEGRINGAYNQGPAALIQTVKDNLGIPIHRYMEVDFVTFADLVDAVGGITIEFPNPAFDTQSGLNVEQAGPVELDGREALAYVRSRNYTEIINGEQVTDATADLGRVVRQQQFLREVMSAAGDSRNPITLMRIGSAVSGGLRIDDDMSLFDALHLTWDLRGLDPEPVELPTIPDRTPGGAAVLLLGDGSDAALDRFR
jgi:LCP family protein required for cell wall assembly